MANTYLMSIEELALATKAELIEGSARVEGFSSVSIDSRKAQDGSLFIALQGTTQDGHDYVEAAFERGARVALVSASQMQARGPALRMIAEKHGSRLLVVKDTLLGLQMAAGAYLEKFPSLIRIGITGSSGKTTTKEIAAAMIGIEKKVVMNEGNLNSETGLPLSVFTIRDEHELGIFEMGMNRKGEMAELAAVLRPQIALITNIGTAHIGILGSREQIALEKKAIFSQFSGPELALIPEDDAFAEYLASGLAGRVQKYGKKSLVDFNSSKSLGLEGTEIIWAGKPSLFPLPGAHNLSNALSAAAIAKAVSCSDEAIRGGLASIQPLFGRGEVFKGDCTVLRDCYNANPESTQAAIHFCDEVEWPGRRVYVIGAMFELGSSTQEAHRKLGELLGASKAELIFLFGHETEDTKLSLEADPKARGKKIFHTNEIEELSSMIQKEKMSGDLILLKGSRGTALERLSTVLSEKPAPSRIGA